MHGICASPLLLRAPTRRQGGLRLWTRFLAATGLALGLAFGAVSGPQQPVEPFEGQAAPGGAADPMVQDQIDAAFRVFGDLLAVSQKAAEPMAHWRVTRASWRDAQAAWEKASAALPALVQGLQRCWPPLQKARSLVEQAQQLFLQATADTSNPRALELLLEHKDLQNQAEGPLQAAAECYRAALTISLTR